MRKQKLWVVSAAFVLLFLGSMLWTAFENAKTLQTSATDRGLRTVVIDAGHGGFDGGTVAEDGTLEKEINLSIAKRLQALLQCAGIQTVMTRETDDSIHDPGCTTVRKQKISDIHHRLQIMEETPDSVFVSIHQNHFTQSVYHGTQVFYSGNDARSRSLAEAIQLAVVTATQPDNKRQVKQSGTEIYLLYHAMRPAVMVECGFLSNPQEASLLKTPQYQTKIALSILQGILDYREKAEEV
ncbi:MAG: N-acetylmuramoyl-L-alanine amidase [Clostridia bacterium]|nr:N-acetylmuramoyl-L-alanine amidase [Clostridia bacterium]